MTTWVPSSEDYENEVTAFSSSENYSLKVLLYSNEAAWFSDIAEADGSVEAGTMTEAELDEMTAYSDGYAMKVTFSFPKTTELNDGRGVCIFNVLEGGSCFFM